MKRFLLLLSCVFAMMACRQQREPSRPNADPGEKLESPQHLNDASVQDIPDAAVVADPRNSDFDVSNTVAPCAEATVATTALGSRRLSLNIKVVVQKNIGLCGCVSALLRYRVLVGDRDSLRQVATGTINSMLFSRKPFETNLRVSKGRTPYTVQLSCNGG